MNTVTARSSLEDKLPIYCGEGIENCRNVRMDLLLGLFPAYSTSRQYPFAAARRR